MVFPLSVLCAAARSPSRSSRLLQSVLVLWTLASLAILAQQGCTTKNAPRIRFKTFVKLTHHTGQSTTNSQILSIKLLQSPETEIGVNLLGKSCEITSSELIFGGFRPFGTTVTSSRASHSGASSCPAKHCIPASYPRLTSSPAAVSQMQK